MESIIATIITTMSNELKHTEKTALKDDYQTLKNKLISVDGDKPEMEKTIDEFERQPNSQDSQRALNTVLAKAQVDKRDDILILVNRLQEQLDSEKNNKTIVTKTYNDRSVDMSGSTFHGDINFNQK